MPCRPKKSCWLNMDFKDRGNFIEQTKHRRLRKPCVNQIGLKCAGMLDSSPCEHATIERGKPFNRKIHLKSVMRFEIRDWRLAISDWRYSICNLRILWNNES